METTLSSSEYEDLKKKYEDLAASITEILCKLGGIEAALSERTETIEGKIQTNTDDVSDLQNLYRECRERCVKDQARMGDRIDGLLKPVNEKIEKLFRYVYIGMGMIMLLQFVLR